MPNLYSGATLYGSPNSPAAWRAVRRIDSACKDLHSGIDGKAIADYFDVDFEAVWDVVTRDLAPLELVMRSILARVDDNG